MLLRISDFNQNELVHDISDKSWYLGLLTMKYHFYVTMQHPEEVEQVSVTHSHNWEE